MARQGGDHSTQVKTNKFDRLREIKWFLRTLVCVSHLSNQISQTSRSKPPRDKFCTFSCSEQLDPERPNFVFPWIWNRPLYVMVSSLDLVSTRWNNALPAFPALIVWFSLFLGWSFVADTRRYSECDFGVQFASSRSCSNLVLAGTGRAKFFQFFSFSLVNFLIPIGRSLESGSKLPAFAITWLPWALELVWEIVAGPTIDFEREGKLNNWYLCCLSLMLVLYLFG